MAVTRIPETKIITRLDTEVEFAVTDKTGEIEESVCEITMICPTIRGRELLVINQWEMSDILIHIKDEYPDIFSQIMSDVAGK